jgi:oxygen-independent coproporphyrinogen-3 oxidase
MFNIIEKALASGGLERYEISNFAKPGFESRHNKLYWDDEPYWGVGLSSHSYLKLKPWGVRFWNQRSITDYVTHIDALESWSLSGLVPKDAEYLNENQALTFFTFRYVVKKALIVKILKINFKGPF